MRQILILICLVPMFAFAKVQKISDIPPASINYIDIEHGNCDANCLQNLVNSGMEFSFLSRFKESNANNFLSNLYAKLSGNIKSLIAFGGLDGGSKNSSNSVKIAVLIPQQVIKGYSHVVSDAIFSYVISQNINADIKFYLSGNESSASLRNALSQIKRDGISLVVAPLTVNGARYIASNSDPNTFFFIPTLNYSSVGSSSGNIFFGGISYEDQVRELLNKSSSNLIIYHDGSYLAKTLNGYVEINSNNVIAKNMVDNSKRALFDTIDEKFNESDVFLNLPLSKTEFVINEISINKAKPKAYLTTQINYAPKLLTSIEYGNRENLYIANSISYIPSDISSTASLLGLDMEYNWVAYSTAIGIDYLYSTYSGANKQRVFDEQISGAGIRYDTKIYKTTRYKFIPIN
ncbi:hypothetical protein CBLAS_1162 [Campylobacter blaseri]|uniref:Periplasmic protein n=1 Tax=Campylobacter blaseri TaxID=2042961 RepID=A0A2P8QZQ8_9BACT|nr:hypothetical protein [Campylobacter blaseri]PSM51734.1 hypothetical protein CQ405_06290 [Campylobacter blaseri]PSM53525.1 hypothetical protein CRN67_06295 [Campylobacter blaseri]QKF86335.1 hypothetical protein CBLAS_1162 [Campylobacter blaseri]